MGSSMWTRVKRNTRILGDFSFTAAEVEGTHERHTLLVTDNHMFVKFSVHNYSLIPASGVMVGDIVRHVDGKGSVAAVTHYSAPTKFDIVTEDCTMMANNIFTTTSCESPERQAEFLQHGLQPPATDAQSEANSFV